MIIRFISAFFSMLVIANIATAQSESENIDALYDTLNLSGVIEVMREEGLSYGDILATDLFPGRDTTEWNALLQLIYDETTMESEVKFAFHEALSGKDVSDALSFFSSEPGSTVVDLEISARRALLDDAVEEVANENAALATLEQTPRYQLVKAFVDANDMIEINVVGALNSNYAFMTGLLDGGAFPAEFTQNEILIDVWSQEEGIRTSTTEWAISFLMLAFRPLEDAELEAYIAFSRSEAGQQLNTALFASFDGMLERISRDLGLAASRFMTEQEL